MAIIGRGDIATALREGGVDRDDFIFFASGVSNSGEIDGREYERERNLLLSVDRKTHLVYFSSLCVFYANTLYATHKRCMEALVRLNFGDNGEELRDRWTIVRLGNITWGTNPHTLINYLRAHPEAEIRDEWRYVVDKDEFLHWMRLIPGWPCEMNIPGRRLKVQQIYYEFVTGTYETA